MANGGTGAATLTGLLQGNGTSAFTAITDSTTAGQVLRVTGSNTYAWGALDLADTDAITGDLPFSNLAQLAANSVLANPTGSTADAQSVSTSTLYGAAITAGQVLMSTGSGWTAAATATCVQITGSASLCDGSDAEGAGGGGFDFPNIQSWGNATSTTLGFLQGFLSTASSTINANLTVTGNLGIGTSTPQWLLNPFSSTASQLSLSTGAGIAQWAMRNAGGNLYFATTTVDGTATTTLPAFTILSSGDVGIGIAAPLSFMHIKKDQNTFTSLLIENSSNTGSAAAILTVASADSGGSIYAIPSNYAISPQFADRMAIISGTTAAGLDLGAQVGDMRFYTGGVAITNERMRITSGGNVGIGTTTPTWLLNPTSATAAQLALSSGAGFGQWAFRNAGGNLYFATTTVAGTATTSSSALSIIGSSGLVTLGKDLIVTGNSTTTNATTTALFSTTASSTNLFSTTANLGTVTLGALASALPVSSGGTGAATLTGLLQGNGTSAFTAITDSTTAGQVLRVTGSNTYAWGALDLADTDAITGDLPFSNLAQLAANSVLANPTGSTADAQSVSTSTLYGAAITAGQVLMSTGSGWTAAATATCVQITGSASLCDGSDAEGAGGGGFDFPNIQSWGNATSTTLGFLQGFLSTASSTINANLTITGNSTTTDATSTNFFSTTASSTNLYSSILTVGGTGLIVDSLKRVGIGVTPTYRLDILDSSAGNRGINVAMTGTSGTILGGVFSATGVSTTNIAGYFAASGASGGNIGVQIAGPGEGTNNFSLYVPALAKSYFAGSVGIGTTTPSSRLSVAGAPGGTVPLFMVSSSTAAFATTTVFQIDSNGITTIGDVAGTGDAVFQFANDTNAWSMGYYSTNKSFRIASSTNLTANVYLEIGKTGSTTLSSGIGSVVGTDQSLCIDGATFEVTRQAGDTCAASSARYKHDIVPLGIEGLELLRTFRPVSFIYNSDASSTIHWGFIAEEMASTSPQLAAYNDDGSVQTINLTGITSVLAKSMKELDLNLETLISETANSTSASINFANRFMDSLKTKLANWFADATNGITKFFAKEVHTDTLCVKKSDGQDICITGDQLSALLSGSYSTPGTVTVISPAPTPEPTPEPTASSTEPVTEPVPEPTASSTEPTIEPVAPSVEPITELAPTVEPAPEPTTP